MDKSSDKGAFTFTWRIENFSMCTHRKEEEICSPKFVVDSLEKTTWLLSLYPKGSAATDGGDYVSFFLQRAADENEPDEVTVLYDVKILSLQTESYIQHVGKYSYEKSAGYGSPKFISLKSLMENENTYLPNDVLTIVCCIKWNKESLENKLEAVKILSPVNKNYALEEISTLITADKLPTQYQLNGFTYTTRIPVERSEIKWIIKDFKTQMQTLRKIPVSVLTKMRKKSTLFLHCYLSGAWDGDSNLRIDIEKKDQEIKKMLLKFKVSVLNKKGTAHAYLEEQHIFGEDYEVWSFPSLIKVTAIEKPEYELLNDGALTLQCEFIISYDGKEDLPFNNDVLNNGLENDIGELLKDEELTDVTLISEGLEISVHKSVISARSPVFRAMFLNDTEEKRTGVIHINDIEADTLKSLKSFMYGKNLPDLQPEDVMKLYSAADKYRFLVLKDWCAASLKYTLSVSNVCEVLVLADLHEDAGLLKYVHDFLRLNSLDVLESDAWMNLMENNSKLTSVTMRKIMITQASSLLRCLP